MNDDSSKAPDKDFYEEIYEGALSKLGENIQAKWKEKENGNYRFVSLGRKGIRIYECLPKYESGAVKEKKTDGQRQNPPDVVSEYALPFIFNDEGQGAYSLLDDALYYGSSALGVAKAIYAFSSVYGQGQPKEKIDYYSAIDTGELRLNFNRYIGSQHATETKKNNLEAGYSHYFVKRLARDIRSLNNTFEIEFPIITFGLDRCPDMKQWEEALKAVYSDRGARVYTVEHDVEDNKEKNFSVNVLLRSDGSNFTKLRLFPGISDDGGQPYRVKIVCMSPHTISDENLVFQQLFDQADEGYKEIWDMIYKKCHIDVSKINTDNIVDYLSIARPRCNKSLVIMANFLLSFSTLVEELDRLEEFLGRLNIQYSPKGIDIDKGLYYLLGNGNLCEKVADGLKRLYHERRLCGTVYTAKNLRVNYSVFENSKKINERTFFLLNVQNDYMLEMSQNVEEALGVLFFNQDMFFEKQELAYNPVTQDYNRLRMGFTYEGLQDTIQDSLARGYFALGSNEDFIVTLHRWVDQCIDEASIVPQYVLDDKSKYWIRVFRHGENEDPLLSHLARFVLFVFKEHTSKTQLEWIQKKELEKLLVESYKVVEKGASYELKTRQIVESENICIKIKIKEEEVEELVFTNKRYLDTDGNEKPRNVLKYMVDMCILSEDEPEKITIHPRTKSFFKTGITTMSRQSEENIRARINQYTLQQE